ncbi:hypothetical protein ALC53_13468 [Atta colombica]|uniref:Uncharacterized protein n=1 Tax=Atta colombica TaxID=520822 RepID=A0A195AUR7_9HYME|nr:hypothetical protein ALC53_13468 [Atta colombica]
MRRIKNHTDLYHGHACFPKSEPINSAGDLTWTELRVNDTNRYWGTRQGCLTNATDMSCRASPTSREGSTYEGFSFDVTAIGPLPDDESTMRDGRLTFSLRGTGYDNNRTSLCVPVVDSSGSTDLGPIAYVYPGEH